MEKGIRKIEQNGVHVAYLTCPQIKLNKYKDATMLSLWHINVLRKVKGSISFMLMTKDGLYLVRDKLGRTPLNIDKR